MGLMVDFTASREGGGDDSSLLKSRQTLVMAFYASGFISLELSTIFDNNLR